MNRRRGLSADATFKAAQALYEKTKLVTYPRTDSRYLTSDMRGQVPGILSELRAQHPEAVGRLDLNALAFTGRIVDNAKVRDHHAVIPTGKAPGVRDLRKEKYGRFAVECKETELGSQYRIVRPGIV
jgi:DNA topoisomerase-3